MILVKSSCCFIACLSGSLVEITKIPSLSLSSSLFLIYFHRWLQLVQITLMERRLAKKKKKKKVVICFSGHKMETNKQKRVMQNKAIFLLLLRHHTGHNSWNPVRIILNSGTA